MFHAKKQLAESLIEAIIALTIVSISSVASLGLIRTSVITNRVVEMKASAENLALDGMAEISNLRATNYLRFASDPENCWNTYGVEDVADCASTSQVLSDGNTYYFDNDGEVNKVTASGDGAISLYEWTNDFEGYFYVASGDTSGDLNVIEEDVFTRTFEVSEESDGSLLITMTVEWTVDGADKSLSLIKSFDDIY